MTQDKTKNVVSISYRCELRNAPRRYVTKWPPFASPVCTTTANSRYRFLGNIPPKLYVLNVSFPAAFNCKLDDNNDSCEPHGVLVYGKRFEEKHIAFDVIHHDCFVWVGQLTWLKLGCMKLYGAIDRLSEKLTKSWRLHSWPVGSQVFREMWMHKQAGNCAISLPKNTNYRKLS